MSSIIYLVSLRSARYPLDQCFPTFFCSRHPYLVLRIFGDTPSWFKRYYDRGIVTIGCTPSPAYGTLMRRGIPVGNHCSRLCGQSFSLHKKASAYHNLSLYNRHHDITKGFLKIVFSEWKKSVYRTMLTRPKKLDVSSFDVQWIPLCCCSWKMILLLFLLEIKLISKFCLRYHSGFEIPQKY